MTDVEFQKTCFNAVRKLRNLTPIDTGNLRYNAIKIEFPKSDECHIYVDEAIAPYMPYTNEPWISPKWHGKKNPNEHWFDDSAKFIAEVLAQEMKGEFKE